MENTNTNFDILEILNKENENNSMDLLSTIENKNDNDTFDILNNISEVNKLENEIINNQALNIEYKEEINIKVSVFNKTLNNIVFLFKYFTTSTLIFIFLLSITNYSAYIEIARSYLNPELLEQNKQALLSSVNGANMIGENNNLEKEIVINKESIGEKISMVKNKTYHSMNKLLSGDYDESLNMKIEIVPYENRIIIPKIGKNIPLIEVKNKTVQNVAELDDIFMDELSNGIVRYPGSAKPGELGNSFIFGHSSNFPWMKGNYNDVFALLDNVVFGDEIIAYYNQKKYVYKIKEKKIIKPGDVSILKRDTKKTEISLMTCWPVGTTINRMVVIGELIE